MFGEIFAGNSLSVVTGRQQQLKSWNNSNFANASQSYKKASSVKFDLSTTFLSMCKERDFESAKSLIYKDVDINCTNFDGMTALHQACVDNDLEAVKFLTENNANLNVLDKEGYTPLHASVASGLYEITKYLIENGARLDMLTYDNELAIDLIPKENLNSNSNFLIKTKEDLYNLLESRMIRLNFDREKLKKLEQQVMLEDLIIWEQKNDYSPIIDSFTNATPLHIAACKNYIEVADRLIKLANNKLGVDLNARDCDGWSPLHVAAHYGHFEICKLLIEAGADLNAISFTNQSILEVVYETNTELRQLIEKSIVSRKIQECKYALIPLQEKESLNLETNAPSVSFNATSHSQNGSEEHSLISTGAGLSSNNSSNVQSEDDCLSTCDVELRKMSKVLAPLKVDDSEAQRKSRARLQRNTRRSTQGIASEIIQNAKKIGDTVNSEPFSNTTSTPLPNDSINSVENISNQFNTALNSNPLFPLENLDQNGTLESGLIAWRERRNRRNIDYPNNSLDFVAATQNSNSNSTSNLNQNNAKTISNGSDYTNNSFLREYPVENGTNSEPTSQSTNLTNNFNENTIEMTKNFNSKKYISEINWEQIYKAKCEFERICKDLDVYPRSANNSQKPLLDTIESLVEENIKLKMENTKLVRYMARVREKYQH